MPQGIRIVEVESYTVLAKTLLTEEERAGIRQFLGDNPEGGDVIPGLSGLRKVRWTQASRNKGKRGGTRVIYFYALSHGIIVLLYIYSKEDKEDLSNADRKQLKEEVEELKKAVAGTDDKSRKGPG